MDNETLSDLWQNWAKETTELCKIKAYRGADLSDEEVHAGLKQCRQVIAGIAKNFNQTVMRKHQLVPFQWCGDGKDGTHDPTEEQLAKSPFWVFGYRVGPESASYKVSIICHLDTVPASDGDDWTPFSPKQEERDYDDGTDSPQQFLVGRGCIDDKGPAMSAFIMFRALAQNYDTADPDPFEKTQLEIIFDTSEEWEMSTPVYMKDPDTSRPDFGVVYDAMWIVRAEKGGERPVFVVNRMKESSEVPLYASAMYTSPNNSSNTIPDWAKVEVTGSPKALTIFKETVLDMFRNFAFDDPDYYRGDLSVESATDASGVITKVILNIDVEGAQHGSAPDQNRAEGVNPFVSLSNFVAGLTDDGTFGVNAVSSVAKFIQWTWGTYAFGENQESLYKYDDIFQKDNGTTYGVTKSTMQEDGSVKLEIDIRYALDHHSIAWDGVTEGELEGDSQFSEVFTKLLHEFNTSHSQLGNVSFTTKTLFGPDIRVPDTNENFLKAEEAFRNVMGMDPPRLAIGGGTDAKGNVSLLAMGPLFGTNMGSPINYHGISEGAPMNDMQISTQIIYNVFESELLNPSAARMRKEVRMRKDARVLAALNKMAAKGHKYCCSG
ncbi:putative dipeptidase [Gracilariopsis chorda]|uniref:Putative dipeptidase n=1 Tax=Gracilariopsis chorda TaxID=448386 RepID=A0A2V3IIH6_9FLOR|nr:putative dipeptidase [Gracilariopsis chorda]|eukprot:PXF41848.1 putative dipeptidase [Gracilariopsis chorda]